MAQPNYQYEKRQKELEKKKKKEEKQQRKSQKGSPSPTEGSLAAPEEQKERALPSVYDA